MDDFTHLTPEKLDKMNKKALIAIICSLQSQLNTISSQLNFLTEQITLMNQRSFGRKTEKADQLGYHQMNINEAFNDTLNDVFNEAECASDDSSEPEVTEIIVPAHTRRKKTKREETLDGLPIRIFEHKLNEDELAEKFPNGYKELPVESYKRLSVIPRTFLVDEHRIHVYASKDNDGTIVRADRPADVFRNSIATPSLVSLVAVSKYMNHVPLERQSKAFKDSGINLEPNTLANWMINISDSQLSLIYDELHNYLYDSRVVHADETPFKVIMKDDPEDGNTNYMWVYRNGVCDSKYPVVIYDYQKTRKADHPAEFLKDYKGVLVTDGYQVYHSLGKKRIDLKIAGCWVHAKRKFAEIVKAVGTKGAKSAVAVKASEKISELFHMDSQWDNLSKFEREKHRKDELKPKVEAFFEWAKAALPTLPKESATYSGLNYCINQEQYLTLFLSDGNIPMDNNRAEQAIRPFTLGRKNWVNMYSPKGAHASAVIYSLVETAKANNLRAFDYFEYLITEISKHLQEEQKYKRKDDNFIPDRSYLKDLLPWSKNIQKNFRRQEKKS